MDEQKIALIVIGMMLLSVAAIVIQGITKDFGLTLLAVFSVTITFAVFFFEEWSGEGE
ncbi:MAG: hypothetical protein JXC85_05295 [Candidatus Aenigmarchaeota archaeon]|nr:hypothetical protein [Candidatus Aenigmarchaeota archaeon]